MRCAIWLWRALAVGLAWILCWERRIDIQAAAFVKRSLKRMANGALARHHSLAGIAHSFSARLKTG